MTTTWNTLTKVAKKALDKKGLNGTSDYQKRLDFEISEVVKQGAERYWEDIVNGGKKFDENKNGLLLPWLLGRLKGDADVDPIVNRSDPLITSSKYSYIKNISNKIGHLPFDIDQDDDKPDIDIDCLPHARDEIKAYASKRYGEGNVASVGTWQTYLLKQALGDAYNALGLNVVETKDDFLDVFGSEEGLRQWGNRGEEDESGRRGTGDRTLAVCITKLLPEEINEMKNGGYGVCKGKTDDGECGHKHNKVECPECGSSETETPTLAAILADDDYEILRAFYNRSDRHKKVVEVAVRLIGCVRNAGKHAGAIIIADRNLFGNVPMSLDHKSGQWVSIWTEGRNTQLSKFGYNKWDILGLKNLLYIYVCCKMIEENHNISFGEGLSGLDDLDPEGEGRAGVYWDAGGVKHEIPLHDPAALELANEQRTDAVFQFDTDLAKRILSNGVKSFWDLLIFNAMGHPGPMQCVRSDSKINTDTGFVKICDLDNMINKIAYLDYNGDIGYTNRFSIIKSGEKKMLEFTVGDSKMCVTPEHKILTTTGWKRADEIVEGDEIVQTKK